MYIVPLCLFLVSVIILIFILFKNLQVVKVFKKFTKLTVTYNSTISHVKQSLFIRKRDKTLN